LVFYSEDEQDKEYLEKIKEVKECGIHIPEVTSSRKKYIEDYEVYTHYVFFEVNRSNLHKYIEGILAQSLKFDKPCLPCDVFYVKSDLTKIVNIYDDRGMDILSLDTNM